MGVIYTDNYDADGDEFDYFDEYPEDDPFLPKRTCIDCGGTGARTWEGIEYVCLACNGTGVEN